MKYFKLTRVYHLRNGPFSQFPKWTYASIHSGINSHKNTMKCEIKQPI